MTIYHVILLKFKPGITTTEAEKVRAKLHGLPSQIPAISDFRAGPKIKHPLDHDYDEGQTLIFKGEEARQAFLHHSAHSEYTQYIVPYIQDKIVFDIDAKE